MTVGEWFDRQERDTPALLLRRLREVLAPQAEVPVERLPGVCLAAAERVVVELLEARRFGREGALDLLVADALATYAYEYASRPGQDSDLSALAGAGLARFGGLVLHG